MRNGKKYLIISPHSDDALFSVGHLIFSDKDVSILTVENNPKRIEEDRKLYEFLSRNWNHLSVEFDDQCFYDFHKKYKSLNVSNGHDFLTEYFGRDKLEEIRKAIEGFVQNFINNSKKNVIIYIPWGVGHPFHLFVREVVYNKFKKNPIRYYRDFPHSYKRRATQQVNEQLLDYDLFKSYSVEEFADIKWQLARKFYKTQSGLLWFEQNYIKKNLPEEIYIRK